MSKTKDRTDNDSTADALVDLASDPDTFDPVAAYDAMNASGVDVGEAIKRLETAIEKLKAVPRRMVTYTFTIDTSNASFVDKPEEMMLALAKGLMRAAPPYNSPAGSLYDVNGEIVGTFEKKTGETE